MKHMKSLPHVIGILILIMVQSTFAQSPDASGYAVIIHPSKSGTTLTLEELARIFTGKSQVWQGFSENYQPSTVPDDSSTMASFTGSVLKKSYHQYKGIWDRILFSGGGVPPKSFGTSAEVVAFVAATPGAIGIVEATADTKDTIVLSFK
jgi:ABC-type phosphate transport system substrate-binding protein